MDLAGMPLRDQNPNKRDENSYAGKTCPKFKKKQPTLDTCPQRALIFNTLRDAGCNKQIALTFCKKSICKFDSSKKYDGPREHKIFKIKNEPEKSHAGYYHQQPAYEMQDKFLWSVEDFLSKSDQESVKFQSQFKQKQEESQQEYQSRITNIQTYYDDLDKQFSLKYNKDQPLIDRIRQIKSLQKANSQSCYMAYGNLKLFSLGQQVANNNSNKNSLIEQSEIFNQFGVSLKQVQEDKNFVFTENKGDDEMQFQSQKGMDYDSQSVRSTKSQSKKKQIAEVNKYRNIILKYCNLMKSANMLGNLNKLEDYTEDQKQALIHKQLKKRKTTMTSKQALEQQGVNDFLKDEKNLQMMGKEFNSSKYITQQPKKSKSVDPSVHPKNDQQLKSFVTRQISNLFAQNMSDINTQQLRNINNIREKFQKSHTRKIEQIPEPFIQKGNTMSDMKVQQLNKQLLTKNQSQFSYQTLNSSNNKLKFQKTISSFQCNRQRFADSTFQSQFFNKENEQLQMSRYDSHPTKANLSKIQKIDIIGQFKK